MLHVGVVCIRVQLLRLASATVADGIDGVPRLRELIAAGCGCQADDLDDVKVILQMALLQEHSAVGSCTCCNTKVPRGIV